MNSIRDEQSKESVISRIKLLLYHPSKKFHIVVEGDDDIKFWKKFNIDDSEFYESYSGISGVLNIVEELNNDYVIGICDRDYKIFEMEKIFYYDYSCLESMLFSNEACYNSFISEYYREILDRESFKKMVLENLIYLSLLRKNSYIQGKKIKFDGISPYEYIGYDNEIDINMLQENIKKINIQQNLDSFFENIVFVGMEHKNIYDLIQGHDLTKLIAFYINQRRKSKHISEKNIEKEMRCSFSKDSLQKTKLFISLQAYKLTINEKTDCPTLL